MEPKDDGKRTEYHTGALRSDRTGRGRYDLISPHGLKRLAVQYEEGAKQKGERNWELGFSTSRACCSAIGHLYDHLAGDRSEDHLAAVAWQMMAAMHFEELIKLGKLPEELNDVPGSAEDAPCSLDALMEVLHEEWNQTDIASKTELLELLCKMLAQVQQVEERTSNGAK